MNSASVEAPLAASLLRVYCEMSDLADGQPLHEAILHAARQAGLPGVTVLAGIQGFGRSGHFFDSGLSEVLIDEEPLVVEMVDVPDRLAAFMPRLHELVRGRRLITVEPVRAVVYAAGEKAQG